MFVIMSYDAQSRRCGKLRKIAKKYLYPVQRSLFQGFITEKQCRLMKEEIEKIADTDNDSVVIYKLPNSYCLQTDEIGASELRDIYML